MGSVASAKRCVVPHSYSLILTLGCVFPTVKKGYFVLSKRLDLQGALVQRHCIPSTAKIPMRS